MEGFRGRWIWRCTQCDHAFCAPPPPGELLHAYYTEAGTAHAARAEDSSRVRSIVRDLLLTVRARLRLERWPVGRDQLRMLEAQVESASRDDWLAGARTLEVGAGSAVFSRAVRARFGRRVTCDIAEPSRFYAAAYRRNRLRVIAKGLDDVPDESRYDVVHSAHFIEHLGDPKAAFEKIRRLVRPSGLVFTEVPNCEPPYWDVYRYPDPPHLQFFTPRSLRALAGVTGFEVCSLETSGGLIEGDVGLLLEDTSEVIDDDEVERLLAVRRSKLDAKVGSTLRGPKENLRMVMRPSPSRVVSSTHRGE